MILNLIILIVVIALVVWLLGLLPLPAPFQQIIMVLAIILVVVACLQALFGIDILGHMRSIGGR